MRRRRERGVRRERRKSDYNDPFEHFNDEEFHAAFIFKKRPLWTLLMLLAMIWQAKPEELCSPSSNSSLCCSSLFGKRFILQGGRWCFSNHQVYCAFTLPQIIKVWKKKGNTSYSPTKLYWLKLSERSPFVRRKATFLLTKGLRSESLSQYNFVGL